MFTSLNPGTIGLSLPFEEALGAARDNGFEGLDLNISELAERAVRTSISEIRERFEEAGVRPGGWGLPVNFRGEEPPDEATLERFAAQAELASDLGSPWCCIWILPFSDTLDYAANLAFHTERLKPLAQRLADHGCRLGLEFVGPKTLRHGHAHEFLHTIEGALELGHNLGTGNTGLLLDCFHWYTSHGTVEDLRRLKADDVVYVHVNDARPGRGPDEQIDNERLLAGASGVIDSTGFLHALRDMGYEGPVVVEPFDKELNAQPAADRLRRTGESLAGIMRAAGLR
ncbi:MAG TPA: sugar phosphate isomerase/epimerase [Candidatus Dormibacteraeota bacterium]|jgi:sugar phosphate isomerase/epimerase|nr:sugar phosphate isomerase/epimerase [Candidatus Dormibacteraeota bacterium]